MSDSLLPANFPDGTPQIRQDIKGDRNQVIAQMLGGIVINNLTIHDRVPVAAAPPPIPVAPPLTQQEYRQRQVLINKVNEYWVKGVLETSLHARALIELGLQERPDLVQHPFRDVAEFSQSSEQALPEGTSATTAFEQMGEGRTLLILGEPGFGKTITLLKLAQDLIARTQTDLSQPIPVVLNLSSWARKLQPIEKWLVQELLEKYQVSKALGKRWVETESLILLLDGLDEVKTEHRNACVQAMNQFMQTHGTTELTLCCRIRDYQTLTERLTLRSAICIQPLTLDQIDHYFTQAGKQLSTLRTALSQDQELQQLATSPLMLSIMSLAYQGFATEDLPQVGTTTDYRKRLFDTYIDRMFQRRGTTQQYPRLQTQRWLIWLAQRMTAAAQTVFLIEKLQPSWLKAQSERNFYVVNSVLLGGLIGKLIVTLAAIPISLIWFKVAENFIPGFPIDFHFSFGQFLGSLMRVGLLEACIAGLFVGVSQGEIKTFETLNWSWKKAKDYFPTVWNGFSWFIPGLVGGFIGWRQGPFFGLFLGLVVSLAAGLARWDIKESHESNWSWKPFRHEITAAIPGLVGGSIGGWILGGSGFFLGCFLGTIVGFINSGFTYSELIMKAYPNQGIWKSSKNAFSAAVIVYIFALIGYGLVLVAFYLFSGSHQSQELGLLLFYRSPNALRFSMIAALIAGLTNGGVTCIRHIALRLMLYRLNYSPWNYRHFLDYASDRLFLQKVGGGYIFVHRMLLEYFAAMPLEQRR